MLTAVNNRPHHLAQPTVLFVDDEPRVLNSMRALFRKGYNVRTANSGTEALTILRNHPVQLIISDQRMPHMTGVELLAQARQEFPHISRILLTGYADLDAIEAALNECEVARYLVKPCPPEELRAAAAAVLGAGAAEPEATPSAPGAADAALLADVLVLNPEAASSGEAVASGEPAFSEETVAPSELPTAASARAPGGVTTTAVPVDVLVLSADDQLAASITEACQSLPFDANADVAAFAQGSDAQGLPVCHRVSTVEAARELLHRYRVGVVVTDDVADADSVLALKEALALSAYEPLYIVAAERADATQLIDLINSGAIYRFLLKPVASGQCRLWLQSARRAFQDRTPVAPDGDWLAASEPTVSVSGDAACAANDATGGVDRRPVWWSRLLARIFRKTG